MPIRLTKARRIVSGLVKPQRDATRCNCVSLSSSNRLAASTRAILSGRDRHHAGRFRRKQRSWSSAPLRSLVQDVLAAHHSVNSRRIELSGPDVLVNSRSVTAFSLALNELATNATKYGALSNDEGMVLLNWQIANNRFQMTWREVRGPTVEPPLKRGFGSRLITDNLAQELGGKVEIEYPPEGVLCTIDASLDAIRTSPDNS